MSSKVSSSELARMRDDIEAELMPDTCTILSVTQTSDGAGGWSDTWGTLTSNVPCRLDPINGRNGEAYAAAGIVDFKGYTLTVPFDTGLTIAHRIIHESITYNVKAVRGGSWLVAQRAIVEQV